MVVENLSNNLKNIRKLSGITLEDVGKAVNRSKSTINMWESGKRKPNYEELIKLSEVYNVSILNFFQDTTTNSVLLLKKDGIQKEYTLTDEQFEAIDSIISNITK